MQKNISKKFTADSEAFSIGALVLARLRRTSGRVIDVMYMVENKDYAQYVIDLSLLVEDAELSRLVLRLQNLIDVEQANQPVESVRACKLLKGMKMMMYQGRRKRKFIKHKCRTTILVH